jgi:hypothetical protein
MRLYPVFSWQNFWVGFRWDRFRQRLELYPVPMFGVVLEFGEFREPAAQPVWWGKDQGCNQLHS